MDFEKINQFIYDTAIGFADKFGIPNLAVDILFIFIIAGVLLGFIAVTAMFLIWWERKISAHIQVRFGPMYTGRWHGWAQSIADAIKLLTKEDITPTRADKAVFVAAPVVVFTVAFAAYVVVPFAPGLIPKDLNIGILYIFAISSLGVIGIFMGGWACNNKYSLLGAMRSAAQAISYEVPLVLSILGVIMLTGSLSMTKIVEAQKGLWFVFVQPIGFLVFLIAGIAEVNRLPFDIPEAESELVAGFHIEYSGMKFAMFFLAEYSNMFIVSAMATTLFLGGWGGPLLPPVVWFLIKVYIFLFVMMWLRWTLARMRVDQLMSLGWKVLVPLAFLNIGITGLIMVL